VIEALRGPMVRDVTYAYPGNTDAALDAVSLELAPGLTAIAGPSGSGKSTLLRLLNGLVPGFHGGRIRGTVTVSGLDAMRTPTARLAREVGFVFQDPETQVVRPRVADEVAFALENTGMAPALMGGRVEWAMEATGITDLAGRTTASLSGGERQRVAIAAAMVLRPPLLALDEPTSQLDPEGTARVLGTCADLASAGTLVVVSEHRCGPLLPHTDHLALMSGGRLVGPGPVRATAAVMEDPPPLVALARALGWAQTPVSRSEALALAPPLSGAPRSRASEAGDAAWELRGCSAGHGRGVVFSDVSLAGGSGEVTVLMGPNGGGKTTLMRTIAGLHRPRSGSAWRRPGRVAYLPQDPGILLHRRSVQAEVDYTLARAHSDQPRDFILGRLGLAELAPRYPGDLSSGQRQRAALAAILAGRPRLVLLDEPTRGMDTPAREALVGILREIVGAGAAAVVATHDPELAADLADRVYFVEAGTVRDGGPPHVALSGPTAYATDIGSLYPGGPVTLGGLLECL
jgi:energy-coupling factor transporter ATP-binding protein EcfA2